MLSQAILDSVPFSIRTIRRLSSGCVDSTLGLNHLRALYFIQEGLGQTQIAETMQISMAAVSKLISGLEQKKLLKRKPGEDRRSLVLQLTPAGKKILSKISDHVSQKIDKASKVLSESEKNDVIKGLKALKKLMKVVNDD